MKNKIFYLLFLFLIFLYSCDKGFYRDLYIINHCNDSINIKIVYVRNFPSEEFDVAPNYYYLWYSGFIGYGTHPKNFITKDIYENIIVTKKGIISKFDYVDPEKWVFDEYENNKFSVYLIINPEDFE